MDKEKIKFGDLSLPIKVNIILSWVVSILFILSFLIGFTIGILSEV